MAEISYPEDWREIPAETWAKMLMTPEQYTAMRLERLTREEAAPAVGDPAPDFRLELLTPKGKRTGRMVSLSSSFASNPQNSGRPVGLIFGSYT
ncbi:MAG: hypothetical protein OSB58_01070 [Alphaproteobacteria bacterium]|nr:hypothetical protein [Alphaproteobacteria bacterium]